MLHQTPISKAIGYARNQRVALRRFFDDGRLRTCSRASATRSCSIPTNISSLPSSIPRAQRYHSSGRGAPEGT